jgi:predicted nucleic acid-binding protein
VSHYIFVDASALVKRYHPERGSEVVELIFNGLFAQDDPFISVSALGLAETVSVLVRKKNRGDLSTKGFQMAQARLTVETSRFLVAPLSNIVVSQSLAFIGKYSINASDAICLYQAVSWQNLVRLQEMSNRVSFMTSDKRLLRAAQAEGLLVLDPETATVLEASALLTS